MEEGVSGAATVSERALERQTLLEPRASVWEVALPEPESDASEPAERLAAAGLGVIQDRTTGRVVRAISDEDGPVAEMALDTTTYDLGDRTTESREIEVEQLGGADDAARALGEALLAAFPDRLRPATKGKFGRGLVLGRN